jgi:serine/threonine protein kinase
VGATLYQMISGSPPYQAENTRKLESLIRSKRPPRALPLACPAPLRAIAMKALAPDASRRYRSARDFQGDLQAFLENKPVRAEMERRHGWNAGATIQRIRKVTHTVVQFHRHLQVVNGVSWFLLGMALWIGATMTWRWVRQPRLTLQLPAIVAPRAPAQAFDKAPGFEPTPPPPPAKPHRKPKPRRPRIWR